MTHKKDDDIATKAKEIAYPRIYTILTLAGQHVNIVPAMTIAMIIFLLLHVIFSVLLN